MIVSEEGADRHSACTWGFEPPSVVLLRHLSMRVFALTMSSLLLRVLLVRIGGQAETMPVWIIITLFYFIFYSKSFIV